MRPPNTTNMLTVAVRARRIEAIAFLLKEGAHADFPWFDEGASSVFERRLSEWAPSVDSLRELRMLLTDGELQSQRDIEHFDILGYLLSMALIYKVPQSTSLNLQCTRPTRRAQYKPSHSCEGFSGPEHEKDDSGRRLRPLPSESIAISLHEASTSSPSQLTHEPLTGFKPIRLVELEPYDGSTDQIRCQIRHVELAESGYYETLSYAWSNREDMIPILANGKELEVTRSLWTALIKLRWRGPKRTLWWIDELCINFLDTQEKKEQFGILRDIYLSAGQVLCWLGEGDPGSDALFEFLRFLKSSIASPFPQPYEKLIPSPTYTRDVQEAFYGLLKRPW